MPEGCFEDELFRFATGADAVAALLGDAGLLFFPGEDGELREPGLP